MKGTNCSTARNGAPHPLHTCMHNYVVYSDTHIKKKHGFVGSSCYGHHLNILTHVVACFNTAESAIAYQNMLPWYPSQLMLVLDASTNFTISKHFSRDNVAD